jgi:hypothetical protein
MINDIDIDHQIGNPIQSLELINSMELTTELNNVED